MWWLPCDMDKIVELCNKNNIILLEDCSHAHWSEYKWKKVGTFWDIAAWSLQWQKTLTWWEWWIFATNNSEYFYRWLLLWHYNKRCKTEIPINHELYRYTTTGFWMKFRSHPLAIAIANHELTKLDDYIRIRNEFATLIISELKDIDFLLMPEFDNKKPSWYAFIMKYDESKANNIPIELFLKALNEEWLIEIEIPWSTCPIHNYPLFSELSKVKPIFYEDKVYKQYDDEFKNAITYFKNILKFPVWSQEKDKDIVIKYIKWIKKVAFYIKTDPFLFKNFTK